ncbi:hypothetical protein NM208_g8765 [Fusarium decemcellulare]|uniref:Uncharacterized protein n=2 Tax=Fusarium decemcellulare TaxID=57161 RepID=A0ACC1S426_9HYPO|nr:hypothetical protein NM208_g9700 [Fusarium decemcellulare]KAJ3531702.1 hypothetical protein NM208_g8765 [Fusarium decemcellulare]
MKATFAIISLFMAPALAAAVPDDKGWFIRRADEMDLSDLPIVDLEILDERFKGVTFNGTAESIYKEMKELKPELFTNEKVVASGEVGPLAKRQSSINCNWGTRIGSWNQCIEGSFYLERLGTARCGVNAGACARVSCSHNCGVFLCNKLDRHLWVHCGDIPRDMNAIATECRTVVGSLRGARDFASHFIGLSTNNC